ncbi:hypothetical protein SDC9_138381 [bioreactor metagenome]|uniref:Uncharacterized protein n=1 Tax=bioreactor metagenome TaxID=1076179 RepID=A0A645DP61_9ZZZZ
MTEKLIEQITDTVMKRISLSVYTHRAVLVKREYCDMDFLCGLLHAMEAEGFAFTPYRLTDERPSDLSLRTVCREMILDEEGIMSLQELVGAHETVIIGDLSVGQLSALRDLRVEGPLLTLVYETLRQGKKVYALSRDMELQGHNIGLERKAKALIAELQNCGLTLVTRTGSCGVRLEKNMITLPDVLSIEVGPVLVRNDTAFTTTAKKYLTERGIDIIRH